MRQGKDRIAAYRAEVEAEAELARADLDEIEGHLRMLADDLQTTGMPRAEALATACRRMGEPRVVAREHARVRSPFGAKLPQLRAWSAAVLLAPWWFQFARMTLAGPGVASIYGINLVISTVVLCGLIARTSWARAIVFGALSWLVVDQAIAWAWSGVPATSLACVQTACQATAFLFVAPWRRIELAPAGWTIVLLAWAYHGTSVILMHELARPDQMPFVSPATSLALVGTLVAGLGTLMRARWAALAAAAAALGLIVGYLDLRVLDRFTAEPATLRVFGAIAAGAVAAALAAMLSGRTARSVVGTLRHVLD